MKKILLLEVDLVKGTVFDVQDSTFAPGKRFCEHSHTYYEFFIVVGGVLEHCRNNCKEILKPGALCLLTPQDRHALCNPSGKEDTHIINFVFTRELFEETTHELIRELSYNPHDGQSVIPCLSRNEWLMIYNKAAIFLDDIANMHDSYYQLLFKSLLMDVVICLAKRNSDGDRHAPAWLEIACQGMRKKECYQIGLSCFVQLAGCSKEHLCRSMRQYYNTTPQKYILSLRLNAAASLLRNSRIQLYEIMLETGFNNESYFRRCFKKKFGYPPKQYARRCLRIFNPQS